MNMNRDTTHDWARLPERLDNEIERSHMVVQDSANARSAVMPNAWQETTLGRLL